MLSRAALYVVMLISYVTALATPGGAGAPELLDRARAQGGAAMIVQLRVSDGADEQAIRAAQDRLLSELASVPHRVTRRYSTIPFIALELSAAALRVVASSPFVVGVTEDIDLSPNRTPRAPR